MLRRANLTASLLVAVGALYVGCTQNFDQFTTPGSESPVTSSSSASSSGTGGAGGSSACVDDLGCNDLNVCTTDTCDKGAGLCQHTTIADGPAPGLVDAPDDCIDAVCQGGMLGQVADDTEVPKDDLDPCTEQACVGGVNKATPAPIDTPCGAGSLVCDANGVCVGCTKSGQCPDVAECKVKQCTAGQCVPGNAAAGDNCAAGSCDGNGACVECVADNDCDVASSEVCEMATHTCVTSCGDGMKNGLESDTDCGNACPLMKCADGKACVNSADCQSQVCQGSLCQAPTCSDGKKNGMETDVDCGSSCNAPNKLCVNGKACAADNDCASGQCTGGVCTPCNKDGIKNGQETGVDCGNVCGMGNKCPDGQTCGANNDCTNNQCAGGLCISCMDNIKNGGEDDVDCGNACPGKLCALGKSCNMNSDCVSNQCTSMLCTACNGDNMKNGLETGVDCGNVCGAGKLCPDLQGCAANNDCVNNLCVMSVCYAASCGDTMKNNSETDVDCGGGACPKCGAGKSCGGNNDCMQGLTCAGNPKKCQ